MNIGLNNTTKLDFYENLSFGIYRTNNKGEIVYLNQFAKNIFSREKEDSTRFLQSYLKNYDRLERIKKEEGSILEFQERVLLDGEKQKYLKETVKLNKNNDGKLIFIDGVIEDITEEKTFANKIKEANDRVHKAVKFKNDFLAQISHEIRTPINTMFNFLSLLKYESAEDVSGKSAEYFNIIDNAGNRLMRTIDLLLQMSQLQSGIYTSELTKFDFIKDIIFKLYESYKKSAEKKGINFHLNINCTETLYEGDRYAIFQILDNIISNAVNFTKKGEIKIELSRNDGEFIVRVIDTGIGISKDYLNRIFTPFSQEDEGYTRKYDGNGLGLAIVKKYCELNNIDIKIKSKKGEGSEFKIQFSELIK